jgi:hypothetical protein
MASYLMGAPIFEKNEIDIEDVPINPNLKEVFKILSKGDKDPFFFISEMKLGEEYPTAYGDIMTTDWAKSFVDKLNVAPFPMSALGHKNVTTPWERAESHGYVLGGKVINDSLYLKNYLLGGLTEPTKEFAKKTIREMKAGMLSTSISNQQRYVMLMDDTTEETKWYVVESLIGQRNDIVEHDLAASEAAIVARSFKKSDKADESAKKFNTGDKNMDTPIIKKEMLTKLRNLKQSGDLSITEIADSFKLELATDEMKSAMSTLKSIQEITGKENPIEYMKALKEKADRVDEAEFTSYKNEAIKEVFKANETMLPHAEELFSLKKGTKEECLEEAKRIASLKTIKELASKMASDMSKGVNLKLGSETNSADKDGVLEL